MRNTSISLIGGHFVLLKRSALAASFWALAIATSTTAQAQITINMVESDGVVTVTSSGSANISGLTLFDTFSSLNPFIGASYGALSTGAPTAGSYNASAGAYKVVDTAFPTFGTQGYTAALSGGGALVGFQNFYGYTQIYLPLNYVSEAALPTSYATFSGTFESLGLTPGNYSLLWGSGATAGSLTLNIGNSAIPEPGAAGALLGIAAAGVAASRRRRRT